MSNYGFDKSHPLSGQGQANKSPIFNGFGLLEEYHIQMSHRRVTNVPMFHALRGEAVVWGSSFVMTSISRSYPNHVSIPLRVFPFNCQWATPRTLFFTPSTGLPMSPKPT